MMSTEDLSRMSLRDMETYVRRMVEDYLERQYVMDKKKWMTAYDLRGIVKVDAKRRERHKPVYDVRHHSRGERRRKILSWLQSKEGSRAIREKALSSRQGGT